MIKANNSKKPVFHPTFGSRPAQIVGRTEMMDEFLRALDEPVGSRERCRIYTGQRGMGKTALLLELSDLATEKGFVVASVTAYEQMNEDILDALQRNGAPFVSDKKKKVRGASAGAMGFSFGLTFSEEAKEQYGFRSRLTLLCDVLEKHGKGVLILVDEAKTSAQMRQLAITYQHLVGEEKNIAIVMAGLPQAVSGVLNDDVLTFLNRAHKTVLFPIRTADIRDYFQTAFEQLGVSLNAQEIERAAEATEGFPYLMQLIGYYIEKYAKDNHTEKDGYVDAAIRDAKRDLVENVFRPTLAPLSDNDLRFLKAMAKDRSESSVSDICKRMKRANSYIQPYRARLIEAGIIESPRKGKLVFAVPYLGDYLR